MVHIEEGHSALKTEKIVKKLSILLFFEIFVENMGDVIYGWPLSYF